MPERTPSPVSKEPGSKKRVMTTQGQSSAPSQPNPPEIPEHHGTDGRVNPNPNTNLNPVSNVIPNGAAKNLQDALLQLRRVSTKHAKVDHHLTFLSTAITDEIMPNGLAWNITVNVMEANDNINTKIKDHIKNSVTELMEIIREHYDTVETALATEKDALEQTIQDLQTSENQSTIDKAKDDLAKEKDDLTSKLEVKRTKKLRYLKSVKTRKQAPFSGATQERDRYNNRDQYNNRDHYYNRDQHNNQDHYDNRDQYNNRDNLNYPPLSHQQRRSPPPRPMPPPLMRQADSSHWRPPPREHRTDQHENNSGDIVNTFGKFLYNLQQQTSLLLSSLTQLDSRQMRY